MVENRKVEVGTFAFGSLAMADRQVGLVLEAARIVQAGPCGALTSGGASCHHPPGF